MILKDRLLFWLKAFPRGANILFPLSIPNNDYLRQTFGCFREQDDDSQIGVRSKLKKHRGQVLQQMGIFDSESEAAVQNRVY
jgi:hypothetical protein